MDMPAQTSSHTDREASITSPQDSNWMKMVGQYVEDLRFGSVSITVHEGRVVQIEVSTTVRFEKAH